MGGSAKDRAGGITDSLDAGACLREARDVATVPDLPSGGSDTEGSLELGGSWADPGKRFTGDNCQTATYTEGGARSSLYSVTYGFLGQQWMLWIQRLIIVCNMIDSSIVLNKECEYDFLGNFFLFTQILHHQAVQPNTGLSSI